MLENTNTATLAENVEISTNPHLPVKIDTTVGHGSIAVAILLALSVLIKALATLVRSCQD